jgi:hypothetical protein
VSAAPRSFGSIRCPAMRLLDTADVRQLPLEPDLDPSRAPRRAPESSAGPAARVADQPRARAPGRHPLIQLPSGPTLADGPNIRQAILADLAGIPGLSVPVGADASGLPIGLQLPAPWGEEARLLDAAELIEAARGALRAPPAHR